eukprot:gene4813-8399_t
MIWKLFVAVFFFGVCSSQLTWKQCNLYTNIIKTKTFSVSGGKNYQKTINSIDKKLIEQAECSIFKTNLLNGTTGEKKIKVHLKRKISTSSNNILFLSGGSLGKSSSELDFLMDTLFTKLKGDFDIYSIEHRGVGRSERLSCIHTQAETSGSEGGVRITEEEFPSCIEEFKENYPKNEVNGFSTSTIAKDIYEILKNIKSNKKVFIYGLSYGSLVINQLMQMKPSLVSAVILDSPFSPSGDDKNRTLFYHQDENINEAGIEILKECQKNYYCSKETLETGPSGELFQKNVKEYVSKVFERVFLNGTCSEVTTEHNIDFWRNFMAELTMNYYSRDVLPALLFRLDRCDEYDVPVLHKSIELYEERNSVPLSTPQHSSIMKRHVFYSELWGTMNNIPSSEELKQKYKDSYFGFGNSYKSFDLINQWPISEKNEFFNKTFSDNDVSVLILSSKIDSQTPLKYAEEFSKNIISKNKYSYIISNANHFVIMNSPVSSTNGTNDDCGMQILMSFLQNPDVEPSNGCLSLLLPISFRGEPESNFKYFGVADLYNGVYEDPDDKPVVDLYFFITLYSATTVILLVVIGLLTYYVFQLKAKEKEKEEEEDDEDFEYLEQE